MKHILFFIFAFCISCLLSAQTQQGFVKTPTRRNVNGTMTQGKYVPNATVEILFSSNNNKQSHVSGGQGEFSFLASSPYYVTSVTAQKGTFTFIDADFSKKQRRYSLNAVEVLVDDPNVLAKVREEAIAHERSKIRKQIRAKEDEIEELKEANKITTSEYNKMLGELSEYRQSSEAIVHQIAEVYVTTDFEQMDDFNRQLLAFVEDGNFASADSLLKTKGSKEEEFARIKEADAAIKKTKEELQIAEEYNDKDKESFSKRLYSEHLMYLQRPMMQDSALYCLKMRADLDTTNVDAVWEYADLCCDQKKFTDCEKYYLICLRSYIISNNIPNIAAIQNNLGNLYYALHDYANSEKFYKLALENREHLFDQNPDAYRSDLAMTQNNLGNLYSDLQDYANSEKYYKLALENREQLFRQNPDAYRADLAGTQNNLGNLYSYLQDYANSEMYYKLALENREQLFRQNPDAYRADLASTQNNLGNLYRNLQDYANSEKYYKLALENKEQLFRQNHDAYRADLAGTQNNLGSLYCHLHDYANSEKYYKLALENSEQLFLQNPDAYRAALAITQNNLGSLYYDLHDYANSEKYYKLALENYEQLFRQNSDAYRSDLAMTQNNLGNLYIVIHDYANSEKYYKLALENREYLFSQNPEVYCADVASIYWNIMLLYADINDIEGHDKYLSLSLSFYGILYNSQPSVYINDIIKLQNRTVWRLLVKGEIEEALTLAKKTLAMDETKYESKAYLALCYNQKAYEYAKVLNFTNAEKTIDKAIELVPANPNFFDTKGKILLMQGKNDEALEMWKKILEIKPDFLKDYPNGTNLSNGLKKLGLIE